MSVSGSQKDEGLLQADVIEHEDIVGGAEDLNSAQRFLLNYSKDAIWGGWLLGLAGVESYRYTQRESNGPGLDQLMRNEYWFNHSGDSWETASLAIGARGLIETIDTMRVRAGSEAWSPRVKMWTSMIFAMAVPIVIESLGLGIGGNTPGFDAERFGPFVADAMGPIVTGVLAGGSWEFVNFMTDSLNWARGKALAERYGQKWEQFSSKASQLSEDLLSGLGQLSERVQKASDKLTLTINDQSDPFRDFSKNEFKLPEWLTGSPNEKIDRVVGAFQRIWRSRHSED